MKDNKYLLKAGKCLSFIRFNKKKVLVAICVLAAGTYFLSKRGGQLYDCTVAKYDLKRETNFRMLTGKCTVTGKDGNQVYLNQLRGVGDEAL